MATTPTVLPLLGKWRLPDQRYRKARGFLLNAHVAEVMNAAVFVVGRKNVSLDPAHRNDRGLNMAQLLCERMKLPISPRALGSIVLWGAYLHDVGKAGSEFQKLLWDLELAWQKDGRPRDYSYTREYPRHAQAIRHEALSGILAHRYLREELEAHLGEYADLAIIGAMSHHRKLDGIEEAFPPRERQGAVRTSEYSDEHVHTVRLQSFPSPKFWLNGSPGVNGGAPGANGFPPEATSSDLQFSQGELKSLFAELVDRPVFRQEETALTAAVKWLVLLADVYGSLCASKVDCPRVPDEGEEAYERRFVQACIQADRLGYEAFEAEQMRRFRDIDLQVRAEQKLGYEFETNALQEDVRAANGGPLVLEAPTGSGKTVASLLWATGRADDSLLYVTPTMALADQMFADYGLETDQVRHSRAQHSDEWVWTPTGATGPKPEPRAGEELSEAEATRLALNPRLQTAEVTFSTYDQVLGLMTFYQGAILWLPHIVRSQIVFDEAHTISSDPQLHAMHDRFLNWFPNIRVMHMSATLSQHEIERMTQRPTRVRHVEPDPMDESDNAPRYRIRMVPRTLDAEGQNPLMKEFLPGTIWMVNRVREAQSLGKAVECRDKTWVYHARFKEGDRKRIIQDVLTHLGPKSTREGRVIATQAAQLGFDAYAARMITEACPPLDFIQRLGRCNRDRQITGPADVFVYMPEDALPYSRQKEDAWAWMDWIGRFDGKEVSTAMLRHASRAVDLKQTPATLRTRAGRTRRDALRDMMMHADVLHLQDALRKAPDGYFEIRGRTTLRPFLIRTFLTPPDRARLTKHKLGPLLVDGPYDPFLGLLRLHLNE